MSNQKQIITSPAALKELPVYARSLLWYIFEQKEKTEESHYLELEVISDEDGKTFQKITHTCEIPQYYKDYSFLDGAPIDAKVVIKVDNSGICTMMLESEMERAN